MKHERTDPAAPGFTIDTYQHVLPGMQAEAARIFEQLVAPGASSEKPEKSREKRRKKTA